MGKRKQADRAEAIVKGIGALIMVLLLAIMVFALPQILKGKSTSEMMGTMMYMIMGFTILCLVIGVIGLIVWIKVRNKTK